MCLAVKVTDLHQRTSYYRYYLV